MISRLKEKGKKLDQEFSSCTSCIEEHYERTRPPRDELNMKHCLQGFIRNTVAEVFPNLKLNLHLFGSSACGLDSKGDDIDLGVEFVGDKTPEDREALSKVTTKLRNA